MYEIPIASWVEYVNSVIIFLQHIDEEHINHLRPVAKQTEFLQVAW